MSPDTDRRPSRADDIAGIIVVATYMVVEICLWVTHAPWRDEAQAWLVATSLANPADFIVVPGEGHPPLWFWWLRALSSVLDFNQARLLSLVLAIVNALLLFGLLRGRVVLLACLLFSVALTQYWGYHFRPYGLVLLCLLVALHLDRRGRVLPATWIIAVACGLHFFAGSLMAIWLVWQVRRSNGIATLVPPALLALAFGLSAIVSGMGNAEAGPMLPNLLEGALHNLAWAATLDDWRHPLVGLATLALLAVALKDHPLMLVVLAVLLVTFATATAAIYGTYLWHSAFMTMMCFTTFMLVGLDRSRRVALALLLAPQLLFGIGEAATRFMNPDWTQPDLLHATMDDAGPDFQPEHDLVASPDFAGLSIAATHDVQLINGFDGTLLGPIRWRDRDPTMSASTLKTLSTPFWLICKGCEQILSPLRDDGLATKFLAERTTRDDGTSQLYRIDRLP